MSAARRAAVIALLAMGCRREVATDAAAPSRAPDLYATSTNDPPAPAAPSAPATPSAPAAPSAPAMVAVDAPDVPPSTVVALPVAPSSAPSVAPPDADTARILAQARAASQRRDFAAACEGIERAQRHAPGHPAVRATAQRIAHDIEHAYLFERTNHAFYGIVWRCVRQGVPVDTEIFS